MEKMHITQAEALAQVADKVLEELTSRSIEGAAVIALHGDLGAGKTTFMQYLAAKLGVHEAVTSPTFVIMKGYELDDAHKAGSYTQLYHIDAYRIEDIDEMRVLGFEALLQQKDTIIGIEWAENIQQLLPEEVVTLTFTIVGEEREVTIT